VLAEQGNAIVRHAAAVRVDHLVLSYEPEAAACLRLFAECTDTVWCLNFKLLQHLTITAYLAAQLPQTYQRHPVDLHGGLLGYDLRQRLRIRCCVSTLLMVCPAWPLQVMLLVLFAYLLRFGSLKECTACV
jgi:hypothetical protein